MSLADFGSFGGRDRRRDVRMSLEEIEAFLRTCTNQSANYVALRLHPSRVLGWDHRKLAAT